MVRIAGAYARHDHFVAVPADDVVRRGQLHVAQQDPLHLRPLLLRQSEPGAERAAGVPQLPRTVEPSSQETAGLFSSRSRRVLKRRPWSGSGWIDISM